MAFQTPITIKTALDRIQKQEYVLPAIQREFTWKPDQICGLFDSLMQEYPIGSFLFWSVDAEHSQHYTWYGFMREYHRIKNRHCPVLDVPPQKLVAILDGQQRLTSLNIGLRGSHAQKLPRKRWDNPAAFPTTHLYVNLLAAAGENEAGLRYDFRFLTPKQAQAADPTTRWFRVSDVYDFTGHIDPQRALQGLELGNSAIALETLYGLYRLVHEQGVIAYHEEEEQNLDKVLNIFIRVNSAGTPLSYSDLLLSIATAQWPERDARQTVLELVDELNAGSPGFNFSKDLVLKAGLMLADLPSVAFRVTNFNSNNMKVLDDKWDGIALALKTARTLLADFGLSQENLAADSVLIPIAYYLFKRDLSETYTTSASHREDRARIQGWVYRSLLKSGVWGSGLDSLLLAVREAIRGNDTGSFPLEAVEAAFKRRGKALSFTEEELEDLVDRRYGDARTFVMLACLYSFVDFRNSFHVDHIFPRAGFAKGKLKKAGIAEDDIHAIRLKSERMPNLQLLFGSENISKQDKAPAQWLLDKFPDSASRANYTQMHDLGALPESISGFSTWYETRRKKMLERMREVLDVIGKSADDTQPEASPTKGARGEAELLAAYFLSRCGPDAPPPQLEVGTWHEAYLSFFEALGEDRDEAVFCNSLKNARDTFDAFVDNSRQGWHQNKELPGPFAHVLGKSIAKNDEQLWSQVRKFAAGGGSHD